MNLFNATFNVIQSVNCDICAKKLLNYKIISILHIIENKITKILNRKKEKFALKLLFCYLNYYTYC